MRPDIEAIRARCEAATKIGPEIDVIAVTLGEVRELVGYVEVLEAAIKILGRDARGCPGKHWDKCREFKTCGECWVISLGLKELIDK
ncbi:MAG: hypothetical protein AAGU23_06590 [Bacillota bacterium]